MILSGEARTLIIDLMERKSFSLSNSSDRVMLSTYKNCAHITETFTNFDAAEKIVLFENRINNSCFKTLEVKDTHYLYTIEEARRETLDSEGEACYSNGLVYYPDCLVDFKNITNNFTHIVYFPEEK